MVIFSAYSRANYHPVNRKESFYHSVLAKLDIYLYMPSKFYYVEQEQTTGKRITLMAEGIGGHEMSSSAECHNESFMYKY